MTNGKLEWIGVRPADRDTIVVLSSAKALADYGLEGDKSSLKQGGKRQVTITCVENITYLKAYTTRSELNPDDFRRNLLVSGLNLNKLKHEKFYIGDVLFEGTGDCAPCKKMNKVLDKGTFRSMDGKGGITATILVGGTISLGDKVKLL
jgi:MOSC domain-containing protein YiiM